MEPTSAASLRQVDRVLRDEEVQIVSVGKLLGTLGIQSLELAEPRHSLRDAMGNLRGLDRDAGVFDDLEIDVSTAGDPDARSVAIGVTRVGEEVRSDRLA